MPGRVSPSMVEFSGRLFGGPLLEKREKWRTPSHFGSVLRGQDNPGLPLWNR